MDTRPYIDLPFVPGGRDWDGVDCWGLIVLAYEREGFGSLPDYPGAGVRNDRLDNVKLAKAVRDRMPEFHLVNEPRVGDIVLLKPRGRPMHVGLLTSTVPLRMMHTESGVGVCVEKVYGLMWQHRVEGIYRYDG